MAARRSLSDPPHSSLPSIDLEGSLGKYSNIQRGSKSLHPSHQKRESKLPTQLKSKEDTINLLQTLTKASKDNANATSSSRDRPDLFPIIPSSLRKQTRSTGGNEFFSGKNGTFLDHGTVERREKRIADLKRGLVMSGKEFNLLKSAHKNLQAEVGRLEEELRVASLGDRAQESNQKQLTSIKIELNNLKEKCMTESTVNKVYKFVATTIAAYPAESINNMRRAEETIRKKQSDILEMTKKAKAADEAKAKVMASSRQLLKAQSRRENIRASILARVEEQRMEMRKEIEDEYKQEERRKDIMLEVAGDMMGVDEESLFSKGGDGGDIEARAAAVARKRAEMEYKREKWDVAWRRIKLGKPTINNFDQVFEKWVQKDISLNGSC